MPYRVHKKKKKKVITGNVEASPVPPVSSTSSSEDDDDDDDEKGKETGKGDDDVESKSLEVPPENPSPTDEYKHPFLIGPGRRRLLSFFFLALHPIPSTHGPDQSKHCSLDSIQNGRCAGNVFLFFCVCLL